MSRKNSSSKKQKVYRMKGCSKKTRKNYSGGSSSVPLAFPSNHIKSVPNSYYQNIKVLLSSQKSQPPKPQNPITARVARDIID